MTYSCPICKQHRRHELHTKECSEKARLIKVDRTKPPKQYYPDFSLKTYRPRPTRGLCNE